ncbi:MAG: Mrp/NBP35 family ATP-binding protein [Verrucomicrobiales bacterium]
MSSSEITEDQVREALKRVPYPGFSRDIVSFGLVKNVSVEGGHVKVLISLQTKDPEVPKQVFHQAKEALHAIPGATKVDIDFDVKDPGQTGAGGAIQAGLPGVKNIIAVASGKGGVGKSTVSVNLAVALQKQGYKVGLCDCDLYGPSVAHMFGSNARPNATEDNEIIPIESDGLKLISMGFLLEDPSPVIVRGPLATRYTQQFLKQVTWGELDYLILDLPPGTGDIQLTIVQTVALTGAIIVTTPQEVALIDARKAVSMFEKVNVSVMGFVENMSYFLSPSDGVKYHIFGEGGGAREAAALGVPLLGQIPIDLATREGGDVGRPVALADPAISEASRIFADIAKSVVGYAPA